MWINQHVGRCIKLSADKRCGETLTLSDPDGQQSACVTIEEVPPSTSVIVPQQAGQWEIFDPGPYGWRQRCDYILMGETTEHYFAILIELKTKAPNDKGDVQLKWSLPLFHYLLSSYCTDKHSSVWRKSIKIKYFQIGIDLYKQHKDLIRIDEGTFFKKNIEGRIEILYSESDLFSLDLLLKATAQP